MKPRTQKWKYASGTQWSRTKVPWRENGGTFEANRSHFHRLSAFSSHWAPSRYSRLPLLQRHLRATTITDKRILPRPPLWLGGLSGFHRTKLYHKYSKYIWNAFTRLRQIHHFSPLAAKPLMPFLERDWDLEKSVRLFYFLFLSKLKLGKPSIVKKKIFCEIIS